MHSVLKKIENRCILEIQRKGREGTIAMVWQLHNYQVLKDALNETRILCQPLHHFRSNGTLMYAWEKGRKRERGKGWRGERLEYREKYNKKVYLSSLTNVPSTSSTPMPQPICVCTLNTSHTYTWLNNMHFHESCLCKIKVALFIGLAYSPCAPDSPWSSKN